MDGISPASNSCQTESADQNMVADSLHSRVQHFYLHTKNAISNILAESDPVYQSSRQQEDRPTSELQPSPETVPNCPPSQWTSLPSVVTWNIGPSASKSKHSALRFLSRIAQPMQAASESLLLPFIVIGSNLADAWDLRDLADDLRFRGGVQRPNQGRVSCFLCPCAHCHAGDSTSLLARCSAWTSPAQRLGRIAGAKRTCGGHSHSCIW
jgi:hypothetical protein